MKMTCSFPERLSPALSEYTQAVLGGAIRGVGHLPSDIQKIIEWVGISYEGDNPLPLSDDRFRLEVKLGFEVCHKAVPSSAAFNVDIYGGDLVSRVAEELRTHVLLMIEQHVRQIDQAALKTRQLLA
jgi:hypothetical protein